MMPFNFEQNKEFEGSWLVVMDVKNCSTFSQPVNEDVPSRNTISSFLDCLQLSVFS